MNPAGPPIPSRTQDTRRAPAELSLPQIKRGCASLRRDGAARVTLCLGRPARAGAPNCDQLGALFVSLIPASQLSGVGREPVEGAARR